MGAQATGATVTPRAATRRRSMPTSWRPCSRQRCRICSTSQPSTGSLLRLPSSSRATGAKPPERQHLREAVLAGDDERLDASIERMAARVMPELAIHRRLIATRRLNRRQILEQHIQAWADALGRPADDERHGETRALNTELREWFTEILVANTVADTVMTAHQRPSPTEGRFPPAAEVRVNRRAWARTSRNAGQTPRRQAAWSNEQILAALQDWTTRHGRPPNSCEWIAGSPDRPSSICVRRRFGSWEHALKRAGLKPNTRRQGRYWTNAEILSALKAWTKRHEQPPKATDWTHAHRSHPCARSVTQRYGSFKAALAAAKLA